MTSYERRCDVFTSHRRRYDVVLAPTTNWGSVILANMPLMEHWASKWHNFQTSATTFSLMYAVNQKKMFRKAVARNNKLFSALSYNSESTWVGHTNLNVFADQY